MGTGHNCFGAVLYPMDGYIASFPNTYAEKVGKTNGAMYHACGSSYFSMHCSAIFPRCTLPMTRDEAIPMGGRVPICLHLCVLPLVMCPGFWLGDVIGACSFVSVPPMCTQAFFWNLWRLPPQYEQYDEANPFSQDCPEDNTTGIIETSKLYDETKMETSVIESEAANLPKIIRRGSSKLRNFMMKQKWKHL